MTWIAVGTAVVGAVGSYESAEAAKNGEPKAINVAGAIQDAQTQAANDLQNSLNLEQQYLPGQYANMQGTFGNFNNVLAGQTQSQQLQSNLFSQGSPISSASTSAYVNNPLTTAANSSILQTLNQVQSGNLPASVQAQAVQSALQGAGSAGISGSGAGRGLTARDLGLTQLQLLQSAQGAASQAGNAYGALGLQQQGLSLQNYLGQLGALQSAVGGQQQFALGSEQLANNLQLPNSGLTGAQVASLDVGNTNILNNASGQNAAINSGLINSGVSALTGSGAISGLAGLFGGSSAISGYAASGGIGDDLSLAESI